MEEIKLETLKKDLEEYQKDSKNAVLRHALSATPLRAARIDRIVGWRPSAVACQSDGCHC